ncbi:RidA family protein [Occultella glacieicola]|uniref:RidA family protein n=1 Tax=Occultella glacieicola TaxID=2518684 RepID=A0ABY2E8S2_9MICO|nr:RidA family protein [Occultella glacieicola]
MRLIRSETLAPTEYAYAASAGPGAELVFLAGACPLDETGAVVALGDPVGQANAVVANLRQALADVGLSLTDVVSTRVLVATTSQPDLVRVWEVVRDAFADHDVPSTLIGVTVLGYPGQLVEVEAVAARKA